MRTFRFRAAAVLDLRIRQEDEAAQALARAEGALRQARARVDETADTRRQAQGAARDDETRGARAAEIEWHRNWITRLASDVERQHTEADVRARELAEAERLWREARQRRLVIERMRDRQWRRFQQQQERDELKAIDETARVRHAAPAEWGEPT